MEQEDRRYAIAVDPSERFHLALAHADQTQDQDREQHDDGQAAQKAPFLADGAEDEVGALLGHEIELSLRPLQKALAAEAARAYSYFRLIHVVSPVLEVRLETQQVENALLLVNLHHVMEHVVDRAGKDERTEKQQYESQRIAYLVSVGVDGDGRGGQHDGRQDGRVPADRNSRQRSSGINQDRSEGESRQIDRLAAPQSVGRRFACDTDQNQHDQQHRGLEQERQHEQRDDQEQRDVDPAVESLPEKHEQERAVHEGRSGVVLQHDDRDRQSEDGPYAEQVPEPVYVERVGTHVPRQRQRRRELDELGRLERHRADHDPRFGPVDLFAEKQYADQQQQRQPVERVSQHMVILVVDQQDRQGDEGRDADPYHLHAVALADVEYARVRIVVDGGVYVEPAHQHERRVYRDGHPIDAPEREAIFPFAASHSKDRRSACS